MAAKTFEAAGMDAPALCGGMIRSFAEKPRVAEGRINGGYFVFEKKASGSAPGRTWL
jgi:NDP-sugar pyrophosphorylase family protein